MVIIMVTIITIMGMATVTIITIIGMATVTIITIIGMATVTADGGTVTGTVMASAHAGSGSNLMVTFGTATERREGGLAEAWERTAAPGLTSRGRRPSSHGNHDWRREAARHSAHWAKTTVQNALPSSRQRSNRFFKTIGSRPD